MPIFDIDEASREAAEAQQRELLVIHARSDQAYTLTAAFKFLSVADGSNDANGLVGKIYTQEELGKIKADIYMDSAIVNDLAYTIEPGFVGVSDEPAPAPAQSGAAPQAAPQPAAEAATGEKQDPAAGEAVSDDMLADYLLKIL